MSSTPSITPFQPNTTGLGWTGSLRDLPREHGFEPLRLEGVLPGELSGTRYRARPAILWLFPARAGTG